MPQPPVHVCWLTPAKPKGGGHHRRRALAIGPLGLAIHVEFRVVAAGPPAIQHGLDGRHVHAEQVAERLEVRRRRDDGADVQIAVSPAIEALADAGREGIVDRGMTQRALDADRLG